jgi:hypothetical protein
MGNDPIQPTTGAAVMQRRSSNVGKPAHIKPGIIREELLQIQNAGAFFRLCSVQIRGIEAAFRELERVCRSPEEAVRKRTLRSVNEIRKGK